MKVAFFFFFVPLLPSKTILSEKKGEQVFLVMPLEKNQSHSTMVAW